MLDPITPRPIQPNRVFSGATSSDITPSPFQLIEANIIAANMFSGVYRFANYFARSQERAMALAGYWYAHRTVGNGRWEGAFDGLSPASDSEVF
jgi:hypothetical protein